MPTPSTAPEFAAGDTMHAGVDDLARAHTMASGGASPVAGAGLDDLAHTATKASAEPAGAEVDTEDTRDGEGEGRRQLAALPRRLGRYHVLERLGAGGMGVVFAAYDPDLDRKVAVKLLHANRGTPDLQTRMLREAQALARLSHPNVVQIHDARVDGEHLFIAMEFVHGEDLRSWLAAAPRRTDEILRVFLDAGRGLAAAHAEGLVHRDFKPDNVLVGADGRVRVADFGLARAGREADAGEASAAATAGDGSSLDVSLTATGAVLGTPAYMSPEQHLGVRADARSDQFSFCVALWEALHGQRPFGGINFAEMSLAVIDGQVRPPPADTRVPRRIAEILRRGLAPRPEQRYPDMRALLAALEHDPAKRYRRAGVLVATAAVAGISGVMVADAGGAAVEPCPDARVELAEIWGPQQEDALRTSVAAKLPAHADDTLRQIVPRLDRYATAWTGMRNEACRAHAEGRQSAQLFDLRTACLEQRRSSLAATVEALVGADAASFGGVVQAAAELPSLDTCADVEALTAALPPPDEPAMRAAVQRHREALARAEVLERAGQTRSGLRLADAVLADQATGAYEPLLAEAHLRRGSLQWKDGDMSAALGSLDRALQAALATGHAPVAAQASSRRGFVLAYPLRRPQEALEDLAWSAALNRRVQGDTELYAEFLTYAGVIHASVGDWSSATRAWEEATTLREEHGLMETSEGIGTLYNLGLHSQQIGRYEDALAIFLRVIALSEKVFGVHQAERPLYEATLNHCLISLGRPREALARARQLQAVSAGIESKSARELATSTLGQVELALGEVGPGRRHLDEAQQISPGSTDRLSWSWIMRAAAMDGDVVGMEKARELALSDIEQIEDRRGAEYQLLHLHDGLALAALGRHDEAVETFQAARSALAGSDSVIDRRRRAVLALEIGRSRARLGALDEAEVDLRAALEEFQAVLSPRNLEVADAMLALAELALQRRQRDAAVTWATAGESIYAATAEPDHAPLTRIRAVLAQARDGGPA